MEPSVVRPRSDNREFLIQCTPQVNASDKAFRHSVLHQFVDFSERESRRSLNTRPRCLATLDLVDPAGSSVRFSV